MSLVLNLSVRTSWPASFLHKMKAVNKIKTRCRKYENLQHTSCINKVMISLSKKEKLRGANTFCVNEEDLNSTQL